MAWKIPSGLSIDSTFASSKNDYHVRNICTYERGKGYGLKLVLSKVETPDVLWVLKVCTANTNPLWVSLHTSLGVAANKNLVAKKLTELDRLTICDAGDTKKATVIKAVSDDNSPQPVTLSQCYAQRKMLLDVTDALVKGSGGDLNLVKQWANEFRNSSSDFGDDNEN